MISALAWIPRGAAKSVPQESAFTAEELAAAKKAAGEAAEAADELETDESSSQSMDLSNDGLGSDQEEDSNQVAKAKAFAAALKTSSAPLVSDDVDTAMAALDMDNYDNEDAEGGVRGVFGNTNPGMAYYGANDEDPYIQLSAMKDADSEAEDLEIRGDDFVLLAARNEDDVSHLEVWVYEEADESSPSNLYAHHDILLPAFPLSVAWLDCNPRGDVAAGNLAAVGTMNPGVEIWDLDVADSVEPLASLGGEAGGASEPMPDKEGKLKKQKKKSKARGTVQSCAGKLSDSVSLARKSEQSQQRSLNKTPPQGPCKQCHKTEQFRAGCTVQKRKPLREGSHTDAVLGLSWNSQYRNVLAAGSADHSIKVWDVVQQSCQQTLSWHSDKVQAVVWNPAEAPVLLSGGFDRRACLGDSRSASGNLCWDVSADVEALAWDPFNPTHFLVSSEDGIVAAYDARAGGQSKPLYRLSAHDKPACCLSFNPAAKGLLATASTDKQVKLWDMTDKPSLVASQELKAGALFAAAFCREKPSFYAAGGAKGEIVVWDILSHSTIAEKYGSQLTQ